MCCKTFPSLHSSSTWKLEQWVTETVHVHKRPFTHIEHLFGLFFAQSRARIGAAVARGMALRQRGPPIAGNESTTHRTHRTRAMGCSLMGVSKVFLRHVAPTRYGDQTFAAGEHLAPGFSQWRLALAAWTFMYVCTTWIYFWVFPYFYHCITLLVFSCLFCFCFLIKFVVTQVRWNDKVLAQKVWLKLNWVWVWVQAVALCVTVAVTVAVTVSRLQNTHRAAPALPSVRRSALSRKQWGYVAAIADLDCVAAYQKMPMVTRHWGSPHAAESSMFTNVSTCLRSTEATLSYRPELWAIYIAPWAEFTRQFLPTACTHRMRISVKWTPSTHIPTGPFTSPQTCLPLTETRKLVVSTQNALPFFQVLPTAPNWIRQK